MNKDLENPLLVYKTDDSGNSYPSGMDKSKCVEKLLKYGHYWFDPRLKYYYAYNGRHYQQVEEVLFRKRLISLIGEKFSETALNEVLALFRTRISTTTLSDLKLPDGLINLENGILRLEDRKLLPHSEQYFFFNVIPIKYKAKVDCPKWDQFLQEIFCGHQSLIDLCQEMFGYCLIPGNWLQKSFFLIGTGENGKSTMLEVLRAMLGFNNTSSLSLGDLEHKFKGVQLLNKYANICEESPSAKAVDSEIFKNLVGGGRITVEEKFKPAFDFENKAKLIFAANSSPVMKDHTHALYRRLEILPFDYQVPEDKKKYQFHEILIEELPGILNWSIIGLQRIKENRKLTKSPQAEAAKTEFIRDTDSVKTFLDDMCSFDSKAQIKSSTLFKRYREFCEDRGYLACSDGQFGLRLKTHFPKVKRSRSSKTPREWGYNGVNLAAEHKHNV